MRIHCYCPGIYFILFLANTGKKPLTSVVWNIIQITILSCMNDFRGNIVYNIFFLISVDTLKAVQTFFRGEGDFIGLFKF